MNRRHPGIELLVESAGEETHVGSADGDEGSVDRQSLVLLLLDNHLESGSDGEECLAGAGAAVERNH